MIVSYTLITVLAFGAVGISVSSIVSSFLLNQRIEQQQLAVDKFCIEIAQTLKSKDASALQRETLSASQNFAGRVIIVDPYGVVQVDAASSSNGTFANYQEVAKVLWNGYSKAHGMYQDIIAQGNLFTTQKAWKVYYANQIVYEGELLGAALFSIPIQDVMNQTESIVRQILLIFLAVVLIVLTLSIVLASSLTRPIAKLSQAISRMGLGQFNQRAEVTGNSEIAQLAATFNDMSERLEHMDMLRGEFVSNASHEIKTPLATMKILIESLMYQDEFDPVVTKDFLKDVNSEIDRLTLVVGDLLNLVKIDQAEQKINPGNVRVDALIQDTIKRIAPIAKESGIKITTELQQLSAHVDSLKIQQVVFNLLDNAFKYSDAGATVAVSLRQSGASLVLELEDNGAGIPEKDLPHVFERFYRVDKARARSTGGTGLGLSIVEKIVKMHGGTIAVKSQEGVGTKFMITMPMENKL